MIERFNKLAIAVASIFGAKPCSTVAVCDMKASSDAPLLTAIEHRFSRSDATKIISDFGGYRPADNVGTCVLISLHADSGVARAGDNGRAWLIAHLLEDGTCRKGPFAQKRYNADGRFIGWHAVGEKDAYEILVDAATMSVWKREHIDVSDDGIPDHLVNGDSHVAAVADAATPEEEPAF